MADEELTATHKLRRRHVVEKFERQLNQLYSANSAPCAGP
jgi:hypothetical protein